MSDRFHSALRQRFGFMVPFAPEFLEIPAAIEPVIIEFFERLSALAPELRVQRIWMDGGTLRIAVDGSAHGLEDIILQAEESAAMSKDRFPLRPDDAWHAEMRARYGDVVPDIERLRIRRGLQEIVHDFFEKLLDADRFNACRIHSVSTRTAGFSAIDARFSAASTEADKRMCGRILDRIGERLNAACEHCGKPGEIIAKSGLEALLDDPNAVLGDRLLCAECYQDWSHA